MTRYIALLIFVISPFLVFSQFYKEDDIIPFYAMAGQGRTFPINESNPWKDAYSFHLSIPVLYKEKVWDVQPGIAYYRRRYVATGLTDYNITTHLNIGKRWEFNRFMTGLYLGPSVNIIRHLTSRKTELGINMNIPLSYRLLEELGAGIVTFGEFTRNESSVGFIIIISLYNIPK